MRNFSKLFITLVLGFTFFAYSSQIAHAQLATSAWPKVGYDLQHTSRSPYVGPGVGQMKWTLPLNNEQTDSSPAIGSDGTIYFGGDSSGQSGTFYAANPDGTVKWSYNNATDGFASAPAIAQDGTIYELTLNGTLFAFNPDGTVKWQMSDVVNGIGGQIPDSPTIGVDGTIYFTADNGYLFAVNPDGSTKWVYPVQNFATTSSPAIGTDGTIYVGTLRNYSGSVTPYDFLAIYPDGTLKWQKILATNSDVYSSPAIGADGTIYIGSIGSPINSWNDAGLQAYNPDGSPKWFFATGNCQVQSSAAIDTDGTIYVGCDGINNTGGLYALNPDGTQKWFAGYGNPTYSSPTIGADGTIYISLQNNTSDDMDAFNRDGSIKWVATNDGFYNIVAPIGSDGTLYVNSGGTIYALSDRVPVVGTISVTPNPVQVNSPITATATFTDATPGVTHTAVWDWGDNSTTSATLTESNGSGSISDTHTYTASGIYTVTLTVRNSNGVQATQTFEYVSVYNPTAQGLFSAAHQFTSPTTVSFQSVQNNSGTTNGGPVSFGLAYKYQGSLPVGVRQFVMDFQNTNFKFNATSVTALVISNGVATLTGSGTINGQGTYNFLVTGSAANNTIRVRITDTSNNVIYDTQPGDPDTAAPITAVNGKVIVN